MNAIDAAARPEVDDQELALQLVLHRQRLVVNRIEPLKVISFAQHSLRILLLSIHRLRNIRISLSRWLLGQDKLPGALFVALLRSEQELLRRVQNIRVERMLIGIEALLQSLSLPLGGPLLDALLVFVHLA